MNGRYAAITDDRHEFPELKDTHGEDPARFLQANRSLALARIAGIRDVDLLTAYRTVEQQITDGDGPGRSEVCDALDAREAELTGDKPNAPIDTETSTPATATDGGQPLVDEPAEIHPDVRWLESGQVLVVDRSNSTEFIWPATTENDEPYLLRTFDDQDSERTDAPIGLSTDEIQQRLGYDSERCDTTEIHVDAPRGAARNRGAA
ncbi:hypothetical protein [Natrialba aegyptia]|uniref:DUF8129 domain-containing protein n=1 Tax=Natrialba aegyptia DSM 13077 TaxID=1227491 RepID=M0B4N7_9EURY|nr:hypothetical protein [Natrialba aegyptia]ELZ05790.1 hypothetical protein C480_10345 [Natrialba aegyptia DSM 13077]